MITAVIHEKTTRGVAAEPWADFVIPSGTPGSKKGDRMMFSAFFDSPRRIPTNGRVEVNVAGEPTFTFEYGGCVPSARGSGLFERSSTKLRSAEESDPPRTDASAGIARHAKTHENPDLFEIEYPSYSALPDGKWVQLNAATDKLVIQLKLQKMAPDAICRDVETDVYYVYGVIRFVVHVAAPPPCARPARPEPENDKERALLI